MRIDEIDIAVATPLGGREYDARASASHEARTFDLPGSIWVMMIGSYVVFFGALALAVGGEFGALGMVFISVCFAIMYFGTATIMTRVAKAHRIARRRRVVSDSRNIETLTGRLSYGAAAAQMLTVPILFGFFAICILIIASLAILAD